MLAPSAIASDARFKVRAPSSVWQIISMGGGAAVSLAIFFGIAQARRIGAVRPPPSLDDIVSVTMPLTAPPPPPPEERFREEAAAPASVQLDPAPANSPIRVEAVPIALETLAAPVIRAVRVIPREFTPHLNSGNLEFDSSHIWEKTQVDQKPVVIYRKYPDISGSLYKSIKDPRITVMFVVNADGSVENLHVEHAVDPTFDQLVTDAIKEWQFTPAIKKGRKVRCWLQEEVIIKLPMSNPFEDN
jgi:protein TonB